MSLTETSQLGSWWRWASRHQAAVCHHQDPSWGHHLLRTLTRLWE